MVLGLGVGNLISFALGRTSIAQAESACARYFKSSVMIFPDADPSSALDFDDVADYEHLVRQFDREG
jgi:hypothetical protein